MDIEYLRTFKTITESETFAEAASKLGYTRSTVTFHIQHLEREFGFKLFEKIGRNMQLTQKGQSILPYVDNILLNYQEISKLSAQPEHKVRIAVIESFLACKFQNIIKEVRRRLPDVELDIQTNACSAMHKVLLAGKADLAIHYDVWGHHPYIHTEPIRNYSLVLFGSRELGTRSFADILNDAARPISFIDLEENGFYRQCLEPLLPKCQEFHLNTIVMGSVASLIECVKSNLGIAVLPEYAVAREIEKGTIQPLDVELQPKRIPLAISYHKNKWLSPTLKTIIRIIKETTTSHP
jgi:DNA-binding transcriptional LysR family regulator